MKRIVNTEQVKPTWKCYNCSRSNHKDNTHCWFCGMRKHTKRDRYLCYKCANFMPKKVFCKAFKDDLTKVEMAKDYCSDYVDKQKKHRDEMYDKI